MGRKHSTIKIIVYDDLNQEGVLKLKLILPEKDFSLNHC